MQEFICSAGVPCQGTQLALLRVRGRFHTAAPGALLPWQQQKGHCRRNTYSYGSSDDESRPQPQLNPSLQTTDKDKEGNHTHGNLHDCTIPADF